MSEEIKSEVKSVELSLGLPEKYFPFLVELDGKKIFKLTGYSKPDIAVLFDDNLSATFELEVTPELDEALTHKGYFVVNEEEKKVVEFVYSPDEFLTAKCGSTRQHLGGDTTGTTSRTGSSKIPEQKLF